MTAISFTPQRIFLIDIDALRDDVFQQALADGIIPNLAWLTGGAEFKNGIRFQAVSCAPSVTYTCQASSFTGAQPGEHWIPGNQFFDRFGRMNGGKPRKYEFDVTDFAAVFLGGLAGKLLNPDTPTIYETATQHGLTSTVVYNMYARGAQHWLKPGLDDVAEFVTYQKYGFGEKYDNAMIGDAIEHLRAGHRPYLMTIYFFGLDHEAHLRGPGTERAYLVEAVDRQIGVLLQALEELGLLEGSLFSIFSDHGQADVLNDDTHMLQIGNFFDREVGYVFSAAGLDVHDHLFEGSNCDALLSPSGGMAQVYLKRKGGEWPDAPRFEDTLRLTKTFWEAGWEGSHYPGLRGALQMIAVRDVENQGWRAPYRVFTPDGVRDVAEYLHMHPEINMLDAPHRLAALSSPVSGDILLFANYDLGYNFSLLPYKGMHGGLHPSDSRPVLAFCFPGGSETQIGEMRLALQDGISARCQREGGRMVGNVDMAFGLRRLLGWE